MVERVLAKDESGVRFSVPALGMSEIQKPALVSPRDDARSSAAFPRTDCIQGHARVLCVDAPVVKRISRDASDVVF